MQAAGAQQRSTHCAQLLDDAAQTTRPDRPEVGKDLTKRAGVDARRFGARFSGHRADAIRFQSLEATSVTGKAIDRFARDFWSSRFRHWDELMNKFLMRPGRLVDKDKFVREQPHLRELFPRGQ